MTCSLISIDSPEAGEEASSREMAATQRTLACIAACRIDELFADSKFLRAESLMELVKAIMLAPGPVSRIAATGEDSDTAEVGSLASRASSQVPCSSAAYLLLTLLSFFFFFFWHYTCGFHV